MNLMTKGFKLNGGDRVLRRVAERDELKKRFKNI